MRTYFWEEDIDGNINVYQCGTDRDGIAFGRVPPVCIIPARHGARQQRYLAELITRRLSEFHLTGEMARKQVEKTLD